MTTTAEHDPAKLHAALVEWNRLAEKHGPDHPDTLAASDRIMEALPPAARREMARLMANVFDIVHDSAGVPHSPAEH